MYWKLEEAAKELEKRLKDKKLQAKLNQILNGCPFPPRSAVLARHIATARLEDIQFLKRTRRIGLAPVWGTYLKDRYIPENPSKRRIVKIRTFNGFGRKGGLKTKLFKITKITPPVNGISMENLVTVWGESVKDFHKRVREKILGKTIVIDASQWFKELGGKSVNYYYYYLAGAIGRYILFESFDSPGFDRQLENFKRRVVMSALEKIKKEGLPSPLIVYHPSSEKLAEEIYLKYYPLEIEKFIPRTRK